jgi:hypothetical protein
MKLSTGVAPICERDGFPKLKINGRLECVAEYLDRCIGYQPSLMLFSRERLSTMFLPMDTSYRSSALAVVAHC